MSSFENYGYRGASAQVLKDSGISAGDKVAIEKDDGQISGIVMPRYESAGEEHIVIKLSSGYNVGISVSKIRSIVKQEAQEVKKQPEVVRQISAGKGSELSQIALISTGGTIASKIDYRTGGVRAALTAQELYDSVPELENVAIVTPSVLFSEYSENLTPAHWTKIALEASSRINRGGYAGVVISHGTDTMHYTASALSFALQGSPIPIVLVGAQRSSDRPSSDAASNLLAAATFASKCSVSGVFVAMHQSTSDPSVSIHIGTRVRKNHSSRRDAFESVDQSPVAVVNGENIEFAKGWKEKIQPSKNFEPKPNFDGKVGIVKYHPGLDGGIIGYMKDSGYKALILEGTGLGHVGRQCFASLKQAIDSGVHVFMTSQCIWGRVKMTVYDTGRDLLDIGVIPLSDMLSETAMTKAMWTLANSTNPNEAKELMQKNLAHEITETILVS